MIEIFASTEPVLHACGAAYSFFFDLIRKEFPFRNSAPLHRACTVMRKMGVQCFTREELLVCGEIADEQSAAASRTGGDVEISAIRVTFFRELPRSGDWRSCDESSILGYLVICRLVLPNGDQRAYILESATRVPTIWLPDGSRAGVAHSAPNHYVHCQKTMETVVGTANEYRRFKFPGTFFCQQNDLTHVCAHSALRASMNSSSVSPVDKLTNKAINDLLGINHSEESFVGTYEGNHGKGKASVGLTMDQIAEVIRKLGRNPIMGDFIANPAIDYDGFVYPIIESGCPLILGIFKPNVAHVLTILGHTLNTDRWTPEARHGYGAFPISPYISTLAWADHFIVNDDNFGVHVTLPTESIRNITIPKHNPNLHAGVAIGVMPPDVTLPGYTAEQSAATLAAKLIGLTTPAEGNRWFDVLKNQPLVARTLLRSKTQYLEELKAVVDSSGNSLEPAELAAISGALPQIFWVTEITVPNLYTGNKHKLGDVVTDANATKEQFLRNEITRLAWLPGLLWIRGAGPSGVSQGWSLTGHVPLARDAGGTSPLEW